MGMRKKKITDFFHPLHSKNDLDPLLERIGDAAICAIRGSKPWYPRILYLACTDI